MTAEEQERRCGLRIERAPPGGLEHADMKDRRPWKAGLRYPCLLGFSVERNLSYNCPMSRNTEEILKEALALPMEARAALVGSLLESLDTEVDEDREAAWQREIQRRLAELDSGAVRTVPWAEVRSRLMGTLRHGR